MSVVANVLKVVVIVAGYSFALGSMGAFISSYHFTTPSGVWNGPAERAFARLSESWQLAGWLTGVYALLTASIFMTLRYCVERHSVWRNWFRQLLLSTFLAAATVLLLLAVSTAAG